jgi:hypothetical protein
LKKFNKRFSFSIQGKSKHVYNPNTLNSIGVVSITQHKHGEGGGVDEIFISKFYQALQVLLVKVV